MAYILEPERAQERRCCGAELALLGIGIADPGLEHRNLRLEIVAGKARVTPCDTNDMPSISVEGPSYKALFTDFRSASKLPQQGILFGESCAAQLHDLVFANPTLSIAEHF